jgi:D-ribose pyranose/furanose isomerase RbsD
MEMKNVMALAVLAAWGVMAAGAGGDQAWKGQVSRALPLLGHRNWIVIADAAYPWQTAPGVETVATEEDQLAVVAEVLSALAKTTHVKPAIYLDKELAFVAEADAPGITQYRDNLKKQLGGRAVKTEPHEDIIKKLDAAGQTFHVLLLKTRHTQPYTSVFLQLECGYWSEAAEKRLRAALQATD